MEPSNGGSEAWGGSHAVCSLGRVDYSLVDTLCGVGETANQQGELLVLYCRLVA